MKKLLTVALAALALVACGESAPIDPNAVQQQASSSGVNPWLAGALGFFAGRAMSGGSSAPSNNTTIINKRIIVKQYPEPSKLKTPEVRTTPIAPPPAPKMATTPRYSGPSTYRAPTTTFRSSPSGRR